ncbi:MAG: hypothetical protein R3C11_08250 [Planctomycetaceae bacterium]
MEDSLKTVAYNAIRSAILEGELGEGDRVSEYAFRKAQSQPSPHSRGY